MLKLLLAAMLIAAASLALAANPTATLTVQVVPASSGVPAPAGRRRVHEPHPRRRLHPAGLFQHGELDSELRGVAISERAAFHMALVSHLSLSGPNPSM